MSGQRTAIARPVVTAPPRAVAVLVGLAAWLVYVSSSGGTLATSDAVAMFAQADAILTRGAMDVSRENSSEAWRRADGRYYLPFGPAQAIYNIPFLILGRTAARVAGVTPANQDAIAKAVVALGSTVPAAIAVAFGFLMAWRLSHDERAGLLAAGTLGGGTLLWPYATFGFNAALTTAALTAGVYGMAAGAAGHRRVLAAAGGALGIAWLTRHEMALAAGVALAWLAWRTRQRTDRWRLMASASAGIGLAAIVWMTLNAMHFGHPLRAGHRPEFTFAGAAAFLASPSGAILLYAPAAIAGLGWLPLMRRRHPDAWLAGGVIGVLLCFYASLDDWLGTRSYGPRYLVPLLPLLVAPLALWWRDARPAPWRRVLLSGLIAVSVLVQAPAVVVDFVQAGIAAEQPAQKERRDDWAWAPILVNIRHAAEAVPANVRYLTGRVTPPAPPPGAASLSDRLAFSLNFWWLYLFYLGMLPGWGAAAAALGPLILAMFLARAAYRRTSAAAGAATEGAGRT